MKKKHINWQDGMKVNKDHFLGMENAFRSESIEARASQLTSYAYGLVALPGHGMSLDLFFKLDQTNELVLNLLSCHAITPGGACISVDADSQHKPDLRISQSKLGERIKGSKDGRLYVTVKINAFQRKQVGESLSGEDPPRQPYTEPMIELHIATFEEVSRKSVNGLSEVIVDCLLLKDDKVILDPNYIPPSFRANGSSRLLKIIESWESWLTATLVNDLKDTLRKTVKASARGTGDQKEIAHNVQLVSKCVLRDVLTLVPRFKKYKEAPFLDTLNAFQTIAGNLYTEWLTLPNEGKNRLGNYFREALGVTTFEETINDLLMLKYEHDRCWQAVNAIQHFIRLLSKLYNADSGLPSKDFKWTEIEGEIEIIPTIEPRNRTID